MKMRYLLLLIMTRLLSPVTYGQDSAAYKIFKLDEIIRLAGTNSIAVKIATKSGDIQHAEGEVTKLLRLPSLASGLSYGYISNAEIWSPSFSKHSMAPIPHHFTQLAIQGNETVYKGNQVNTALKGSD